MRRQTFTHSVSRMWTGMNNRPHPQAWSFIRGQVTLEYFILFSIVTAAAVVGLTTLGQSARHSLEGFVTSAATAIGR